MMGPAAWCCFPAGVQHLTYACSLPSTFPDTQERIKKTKTKVKKDRTKGNCENQGQTSKPVPNGMDIYSMRLREILDA